MGFWAEMGFLGNFTGHTSALFQQTIRLVWRFTVCPWLLSRLSSTDKIPSIWKRTETNETEDWCKKNAVIGQKTAGKNLVTENCFCIFGSDREATQKSISCVHLELFILLCQNLSYASFDGLKVGSPCTNVLTSFEIFPQNPLRNHKLCEELVFEVVLSNHRIHHEWLQAKQRWNEFMAAALTSTVVPLIWTTWHRISKLTV